MAADADTGGFDALGMVSGGGGVKGRVSKVRTGIVARTVAAGDLQAPAHLLQLGSQGGHFTSPCSNLKREGGNRRWPQSPWSGVVEKEFVSVFDRSRGRCQDRLRSAVS